MPFGLRHSQQDADHLHRKFGGHVDQEVEGSPGLGGVQQCPGARAQVVLDAADHPRGQARTDQPPDVGVARVVHHIEHLPGHRQILQQGAAVGPVSPGHRRVGIRISEHGKRFGVRRHRPEALPVGGVLGGLVPVHRGFAAMDRE